jgi:hypothetical protein
VTCGNDAEVSLPGLGHIVQVVANLELQEWNRRTEATVSEVMTINVPSQPSPHEVAGMLGDCIGGVVMREFIEESGDVRHHRRPVQQFKEQWVIVQNVEDTGAFLALNIRLAGMRNLFFLFVAPSGYHAKKDILEFIDVVFCKEILQNQIAVVVEEKSL